MKLGLSALVINSDTTKAAWEQGENLWITACSGITMILLSPEMLSTDGFESLVQDQTFWNRVCALSVDEVHLCNSWGEDFRLCFRQIGFARAHLPKRVVLTLATATLAEGAPSDNIYHFFGLREGKFHLIRRSNLCSDIQVLI